MVNLHYDVLVIGGGMAGICAAVSACRGGAKTALVQDRPMLGGNSSSEMRIWAVGATAMGKNRYASETGIIDELDLENLYKNPEGNPYIWDSILLDFVMREENLTLYLNTTALKVAHEQEQINSVFAYQMSTEKYFDLSAEYYIDCTGDGRIAFLCETKFMLGCESKEAFGESLAPSEPSPFTLGNTILLCSESRDKKTKYIPPDFAYDINFIHKLLTEGEKPLELNTSGCDFWWLETGGLQNTIKDGDEIRFDLQKLVYGIWNYIKNSGKFSADNLELTWVGSLPAKRESRRLIGEYILTQNDISQHKIFSDAVCMGGWPIDTHPPGGIYSKKQACTQLDVGVYQIPLRSLYSSTIKNLLFAGRNLSASHLAFASARVMKTCACMGQAIGTAAALSIKWQIAIHNFNEENIKNLQSKLIEDGQWIENVCVQKPDILVKSLSSSGNSAFCNLEKQKLLSLDEDIFILMPPLKKGDNLCFYTKENTKGNVKADIYIGTQKKAFSDIEHISSRDITIQSAKGEINIPINFETPSKKDTLIVLRRTNVQIYTSRHAVCGCVASLGQRTSLKLAYPCFSLSYAYDYFNCANVLNGKNRPTNIPNMWRSENLLQNSAYLLFEISTKHEQEIEMNICFDMDFNRDYNQIKPNYYKNGWDEMPHALIKDFTVFAGDNSQNLHKVTTVENNFKRQVAITLPKSTKFVKFSPLKTWGSEFCNILQVTFK